MGGWSGIVKIKPTQVYISFSFLEGNQTFLVFIKLKLFKKERIRDRMDEVSRKLFSPRDERDSHMT